MKARSLFFLFTALFFGLLPVKVFSQDGSPKVQESVMQDLKVQFNGEFVTMIREDDSKMFFLADFTKLSTRFEKIYFLNQVFRSKVVVNTDADLSHDAVSFSASGNFTKQEAVEEFRLLKKVTDEANATMTTEEKENWLKKNDKYK